MNYKQNEKINQVKESTLVVGIDIGSTTHYARAFDWRGIELGKVFPFSNSREGFENFKGWRQRLQDKYKKSDVIVGIKPTGHYWFDLGAYLEDEGILLVMVNPYAVKQTKELDDNSQSKNDRKDPKVIAKLVTEGRYSAPYTPDGVYADLRIMVANRKRLIRELTQIKNRFARWFAIYFPEYKEVFGDYEAQSSMMLLKKACTPEAIVELGAKPCKVSLIRSISIGLSTSAETRAAFSSCTPHSMEYSGSLMPFGSCGYFLLKLPSAACIGSGRCICRRFPASSPP